MHALIERQSRNIDRNEFRQILRQAGDLHFGAHMRHEAALRFDARRNRRAAEVQGNADANFFALFDALKVDVHHRILERVPLHILQDGRLRLIAHLQIQDGRIKALVLEHDQKLLMAQGESTRGQVAAIKNCRYFSVVTQAAARTFALRITELGNEFKRGFHNLLQLHHNTAPLHRDQLQGHRPNH